MEKRGIPTITVVTSVFRETVRSVLMEQGAPELSLVVVEHPIAGHDLEGVRKKAESAFPAVLAAAISRPPRKPSPK